MPENLRASSHPSFASLASSDFLAEVENKRASHPDNPDEPLNREALVVAAGIGTRQSATNLPARKFGATLLIGASAVVVILGLCSALLFGSSNPTLPSNATAKAVVVDRANNVNLLELDIKGKPYQCRATVDSFASPQIHCEPEGS
jgi:hypothetical protein